MGNFENAYLELDTMLAMKLMAKLAPGFIIKHLLLPILRIILISRCKISANRQDSIVI